MLDMNRRGFLKAAGLGIGSMMIGECGRGGEVTTGHNLVDLPGASRIQQEWQDMELGMFFHFDIPVYKPDWNWRSWKDMPTPDMYNPSKLDTDQWMEAAKAMGAKYAVFVAKHCSGFLQWQSDLYPYGVKQSSWRNGKGDVVGDFVTSCRKYGIKPGLYASMSANGYLEVDNPGLVNRGKGGDDEKQKKYQKTCEQMLTELWSRYGELFEIWFDGGAMPVEKGGPDLLPVLKKYQKDSIVFQGPAANIRWVGNENGVASYPCWATVPNRNDYNGAGEPDGTIWMPGECDVPVRNHDWFWKPNSDHKLYSLDALMNMYYKSVGRNCNLLLNANPGPDGLVPEADFQRYVQFGNEIRRRFGKPLAKTKGNGEIVELKLPRTSLVDHVTIMEEISRGERIREYVIEGLASGNEWSKICEGTSIGHKRIQQFDPVKITALRLRVTKCIARPLIRELAVFSQTHYSM